MLQCGAPWSCVRCGTSHSGTAAQSERFPETELLDLDSALAMADIVLYSSATGSSSA